MKLRITGKLFLVILATNVVIALAVGLAERVSFDRGFREYMREREGERLAALAEALVPLWRAQGSFESLRGNEAQWQRQARFAIMPAPPPGLPHRGPPPPREGQVDAAYPPPPFGERPPGEPPHGPGLPDFPALLDAQRQPVVGRVRDLANAVLRPVTVDGATVGYVAGAPLHEPFSGAERRLAEQQASASVAIAGLAVLLAALVGYLVARGFIAPVKRLADATHRLAAGDYATRVPSMRGDELGQLTADFNRLAVTLGANETLRRDFMADISHELRTPLAILRGELEALEDGIRTLTPARLRSLQAEVATLGKLVEDLYELSLADVGALAFHPQRMDLRDAVEAAVLAFGERFATRGVSLEQPAFAGPVTVDADHRRITQLLNNLLENSVRYTDRGGIVRVAVSREDGEAVLDVMDSPPAVPPEALPRLFDRLYRVDTSRNRRSGGAGLGLALAKAMVEGQGGRIVAQRSPLGGLWVRVTLPLAA